MQRDGATPNTNKFNNQEKIDFSLTILMFTEFLTLIAPVTLLAIPMFFLLRAAIFFNAGRLVLLYGL